MTESAHLLRILGRIRRRARWLAALEGAVAGAAVGTAALALVTALVRARGGGLGWRHAAAVVAAAAVLGAVALAARRIPLGRCARLLDAALDRPLPSRDRALSALAFLDAPATVFSRAAVADAVARAQRLAPGLVAPARRPRTLPLLAGGALALGIVGLLPARAPGARRTAPSGPAAARAHEPRLRIAASALDAEREEARAAATAADAAGDARMSKLASELRAALDALARGELGQGEALDRLRDLAARAAEAAQDAERERASLRAAGRALEPTASTRPLGRALSADEPEATHRALDALADKAADGTEADRAALARALEAAAAAAGEAAQGADSAEPEGAPRRRLNRERTGDASSGGAPAARNGERRLERLHRGLDDAAAGCRGDAETCARKLRENGGELPQAQREASRAGERRRLENAVRQLRERLRRGDLGEPKGGQGERRFARAARGQDSSSDPNEQGQGQQQDGQEGPELGGPRGGDDPAMADAEGDGESVLEQTGGASAGGGEGEGAQGAGQAAGNAEGQQGQGAGVGNGPGGDPLGAASLPPTRGREREAHLKSSAGPTRSEVIEASAQRGFASGDYERVFGDYHAVVEESLASGAVPEGRRYVVRRYFQLIRPRAAAPARKP